LWISLDQNLRIVMVIGFIDFERLNRIRSTGRGRGKNNEQNAVYKSTVFFFFFNNHTEIVHGRSIHNYNKRTTRFNIYVYIYMYIKYTK